MGNRISNRVKSHVGWMGLSAFLMAVFLSGCLSSSELPQTELVFQIHPADPDAPGALGFVNADGTGYKIMPRATSYGMLPIWSPDGARVVYRQSIPLCKFHYFGQIALVGQKVCSKIGGYGRVRWMPDGSAVYATLTEQLAEHSYRSTITSIDPWECKVIDELYVALGEAMDPDLSSSGLFAFWRDWHQYQIIVVDPNTQDERVVGKGVAPSWSPDGERLAYTGMDGLYVVRADGTEPQRVLEYCVRCLETPSGQEWSDWPPLPEWSPDGKWLVYHREESGKYAIYKLNLETREEILVIENGLNPDWRAEPVGQTGK